MKSLNRLGFLICALVLALGLIFYFKQNSSILRAVFNVSPPLESKAAAHFYKNPKLSLANIVLKVFYVVPKNFKDKADPNFENFLKDSLDKIARFHELQFRGLSKLEYDIFPRPIILREANIFYDTENTNKGNPQALLSISQEISDRVLNPGGDLYDEKFAQVEKDEYPVMGLIYEGVGASGSAIYESNLNSAILIAKALGIPESDVRIVKIKKDIEGFFIVNREFLTKPEYAAQGPTILYHEFSHTFGLDDSYDQETNQPFLMDVAGGGRNRPLELTYIDRSSLRDMGVLGD